MAADEVLPGAPDIPADNPPKRGRGRPTKYRREIADNLPEMFSQGQSVAEVARDLGINRATFYNWIDVYPKFKKAYEEGLFISEAFWIQMGRFGALGLRPVQPALWIFNMKNRFKWRDRPDPEQVGEDEMTPEEFAERATRALMDKRRLDGGDSTFANIEMDSSQTPH